MGVGGWGLGVDAAGVSEEFAGRPYRLFDLPQRRAPIESERVQRADLRERRDFVAPHAAAPDQLIERVEARSSMGDGRWAMGDGRRYRQRPEVRTDVTESFMGMQRLQHRRIIAATLRATLLR